MKREKLYDSLTQVDDDLVQEAETHTFRRKKRFRLFGAIAAVLVVAVTAGILLHPASSPLVANAYAIAEAQYPEMAQYPDYMDYLDPETMEISGKNEEDFYEAYDAWYESRKAQWAYAESYSAGDLSDFVRSSTSELLSGTDGENRVYSPLNVYMALAMLAEVTEGDSRAQILSLLGADSLDTLRTRVGAIWNANYRDDGVVTSLLANSLWLDEDISYTQDTLEGLARDYFASSYSGQMGDSAYDEAFRDWLNEQTGGLLEEQVGGLEFSPETVFALASTVYFCAKWQDEFWEDATEEGIFYGAEGDIPCEYMCQSGSDTYYWGTQFGAICRRFEEGGKMWFLLPDEGKTVDDLLADPEAMDFILANGDWENSKDLTVHQRIVKFDVSSQLDLSEGLQALGVTDVFNAAVSDFSPLTDMDGLYLSQATHGARVAIDEEGCTAAAFTVMMGDGAGMPPEEEIDFVLDRPFVFAITGEDGLPLFIGVVNRP
ncbi:MAG: serpin family protein [Faecousia sp.]